MTMTDVKKEKSAKSKDKLPLMLKHVDVHYFPQYWRYSTMQEQHPSLLIFPLVYPRSEGDFRWFYMQHDSMQYHPERKRIHSIKERETIFHTPSFKHRPIN